MSGNTKSLFDLVVDPEDVHPSFETVRTQPVSEPARWMLDDVYQSFTDPDGHFLKEFQSKNGFDARLFELYLFAYFERSRFEVERNHTNPDFIISRDDVRVAVEATTVGPSAAGVLGSIGKTIGDLSASELRDYQRHELPMRFGSPLFSKLQKKYWELPQCEDLPIVLAIEAFHDDDALAFSDGALTSYVYGLDHTAEWDSHGTLSIDFDQIYSHVVGEKEIPSSFFDQPDAKNISAVMFTNAGTVSKFSRMGYQCGVGVTTIDIVRIGYCLNEDANARDPTFFSYNLDDPPFVEPWGQGLVVLHNPKSVHPLPIESFPDAVHTILDDGQPRSFVSAWHPFSSKTIIVHLGEVKEKLAEMLPPRRPRIAVGAITKSEFRALCGFPEPSLVAAEHGWFVDESEAFLGVLLHDKVDKDWGFVVLARDQFFEFRAIEMDSSLPTRDEARQELQQRIARLLAKPQRIFPQD